MLESIWHNAALVVLLLYVTGNNAWPCSPATSTVQGGKETIVCGAFCALDLLPVLHCQIICLYCFPATELWVAHAQSLSART